MALVDNPMMLVCDPMLQIIGSELPGSERHVATGVYEIRHFGGSNYPITPHYDIMDDDYDDRELPISDYGVCDHYEQILERCPLLASAEDRRFSIALTLVTRESQPPEGGWRWHKWGPYIGTQDPQHEYLYDEPNIEQVYVYHIYEWRNEP